MSMRRRSERHHQQDQRIEEFHEPPLHDDLLQLGDEFDLNTIGLARTTSSCDLTRSDCSQGTTSGSQSTETVVGDVTTATDFVPSPPRTGKRHMRSRASLTHLSDAFSKALRPVRSGVNKALHGTTKSGANEPADKPKRSKLKSSNESLQCKHEDVEPHAEAGEALMQVLPAPLTAEYVQSTGLPHTNKGEFASQFIRSIPGPQPMSLGVSSDQKELFHRVARLEAQLETARTELLAAKSASLDNAQTGISRIVLGPNSMPSQLQTEPSVDVNFSQNATDAIEALLSDLKSQAGIEVPAPLSINRKRKADVIERGSSESDSSADEGFKPPVPLKDTRRKSPRIRADSSPMSHRKQGDARPVRRTSQGPRAAITTAQDVMDIFKRSAAQTSEPHQRGDMDAVLVPRSLNISQDKNWPLRSNTTDAIKGASLSYDLEEKENLPVPAVSKVVAAQTLPLPSTSRRQVMSVIFENDEDSVQENATPSKKRETAREPPKSILRTPKNIVKEVSPRRSARCSNRRQLYGEVEGRRIWDEEIF